MNEHETRQEAALLGYLPHEIDRFLKLAQEAPEPHRPFECLDCHGYGLTLGDARDCPGCGGRGVVTEAVLNAQTAQRDRERALREPELIPGIRQDPRQHRFIRGVASVVALFAVVQYWAAWWPYRWWIVGALAVLALVVAVLAGCFAKLCADCWFLRPERCDSGD